MRKFWLIFAQAATISLAILFVISTLKPELLPREEFVVVKEAAAPSDAAKVVSYSEAAKRAMPAVVNIFTSKTVKDAPFTDDPLFRRFFRAPDERAISLGSGVIVSSEGYVLTNNHVVEAAGEIELVLADGRTAAARRIGADPESDLAVLKAELDDLPAITLGSSDTAKIGDVVLAIGNPFGVGQTVTMGIISALQRSQLGINTFENFVQTDAAINPGNSGGALVDIQGNLIGINTAIYSRTGGSLGIGFAIPTSIAKHVMEEIITTGSVTRGWIGVEAQDVSPDLAEAFNLAATKGALISGVLPRGPADVAGIQRGDILVGVEGSRVTDAASMLNLIAPLKPGTSKKFALLRKNDQIELDIIVGRRPSITRRELPPQRLAPP
ncbi:MAG: trypsin-like peptidase domain-containing protein [Burkholderiales bacterium]